MRRRLRRIGLDVMLVAVVIAFGLALAGRGRTAVTAEILSPPDGLAVPAGQAIEVRYRVAGPVQRVELWCEDVLLANDVASAGRELWHTWIPAGPGVACCAVIALDGRGATLASARRCLTVGAEGSPVRLGGP